MLDGEKNIRKTIKDTKKWIHMENQQKNFEGRYLPWWLASIILAIHQVAMKIALVKEILDRFEDCTFPKYPTFLLLLLARPA